ncbi:class I SAM-dependent methyltransferase [Candidatus Pelagibacter bacterium]|nr:class I SAM-dependent methyltransferase [Candidatus Pelagibacter bacterium]MDB2708848.1 class I SAM-dependent methyltransferase [Candidatus Pelagibacter bacterium]
MIKIKNYNTFRFFNYKWKKVPTWAIKTENKYIDWYLKRYGYKNKKKLKTFLKDKKYILDAGCGLGRDSKLFAESNTDAKVFACDQSVHALKIAKKNMKNLKNISFFNHDITKKFNFSQKFDFISCDQVLHHTPNPGRTLKNLYNILEKKGQLNFFVCKKKNKYRDFIDDHIMHNFKDKTPKKIWDFSVQVTKFAKTLHDLNIKNVKFKKKIYKNLQLFAHFNSFRFWYDPKIEFNLSVSSNYDWFSNNPRYDLRQVKQMIKSNLKNCKIKRIYEDDASISVSIIK